MQAAAERAPLSVYPTGAVVENGDWFLWGQGSRAMMGRLRKWRGKESGPWYVVWDEGYGYVTLEEALESARDDFDVFAPALEELACETYVDRKGDG